MNRKPARALACAISALLLVFTPPAFAQTGSKTVTASAPSTTAVKVVSSNSQITGIKITNVGSVIAYLGSTSSVTTSTGDPVYPKTFVEYAGVTDEVWAITASGTADLRVTVIKNGGQVRGGRLETTGFPNTAASGYVPMSDGSGLVAGNVLVKLLTTAVTANSTSCSDAAGSLAITSNATGLGTVFRCDGSTYQLLSNYNAFTQQANLGTVATTGNTDDYIVAAYAGTLVSLDCSGVDALTANDTNYVTATLTNLGQAGGGSTAMLAATDPNTTKATGGTGFAANTKRTFTVSGTGSNLIVAAGDRLRLRFAATGTLANTITFTKCVARFTRLS